MTRPRTLAALSALALCAIVPARGAWAGSPTEQLRQSVDRVLKVLEAPEIKSDGLTGERRAAIRAIAGEIFDFTDISRRALGRHWQARTPDERDEFVRLFGDLLERAYITKIEGYTGERILYLGEVADGAFATVRTRIVTKQGTEVPVDYKMYNQGERWRAYDVNIEGVSLVANYRSQFSSIIGRYSYQELVVRLRAKQDEQAAQETAGRTAAPPSQAR
jgi:phospholipid transport system substrate-binding protein